ncbi:MAG: hypothetical protein RL398_989 [Planctomycetota bacterium]|jgi:hypothetical protein
MAMRSDWFWFGGVAVGLGLMAVGSDLFRPTPPPDGSQLDGAALAGVRAAARSFDEACRAGDLEAVAARATPAHREAMARRLALLDASGVAATGPDELAAWAGTAAAEACRRLQDVAPLAGLVRGGRAAVAVPRSDAEGAQVLVFAWDGSRFLLDGSLHRPGIADRRSAGAAVEAALTR